jgi:hypothetical protein
MTRPVQVVQPAGLTAIDLRGSTVLQGQLRAAIFGQGGRVDLQRVGKVVLDAAQREASALWGAKVASGGLQVTMGEITQSDHKVLVKVWLNEMSGGLGRAYRGFEVEIKYDDKGAVMAECAFRQGQGSNFLPSGSDNIFVLHMNRALGAPRRPPTPTA